MLEHQPLHLDLTQSASPSQILPRKPSLSSNSANWNGIILRQYSQLPPHEFTEYYPQQHLIIIHQQPDRVRVKRNINGKKQSLLVNKSDIAFIPAKNSHGAAWQDELELIVLIIDPDFVSRIAYEWIDPDTIELLPRFAHRDPFIDRVGLLLRDSLLTAEGGHPQAPPLQGGERMTTDNRFYAESMATALSSHLIQHYSAQKPLFREYTGGLSKSKLKRVKEYMRDRLTENISLQEISSEVGLSRCYFAQMFKQSTGITPYQYIVQQRIERAKQLLQQDLPIVEIALSCGFSSQSSLNRTFRKCVGTTPKGYRRQL